MFSPASPTNRIQTALIAFALIIVLAGVLVVSARPATVLAGPAPDNSQAAGLSVQGSATIHTKPDQAVFDFGVTATAATVAEARSQAASAATTALAALATLGIKDADITTTNISLYQQSPNQYSYPNCPVPMPVQIDPAPGASGSGGGSTGVGGPDSSPTDVKPAPTYSPYPGCQAGFTFAETFEVTVRDLAALGPVIDGVTAAGANNISGIRFTLADSTAPESAARSGAVTAAHDKAETLASAAGVRLGSVTTISETSYNPFNYYFKGATDAAGAPAPATPVNPGTIDVTVSVSVTYSLVP